MAQQTAAATLDWRAVERALPDGWRELATERGVIRSNLPVQLAAKIKDIADIMRLVLYQVATNSGLELATAVFAAAGLVSISYVALHKWMIKLAPYLAELLARMVAERHAHFAPERWAGYEIVLCDATAVMRPGAKGTTARVHRALRLTDLRVVEVHVTDDKGGETLRRFHPEANQLWLLDRVYANPPGIEWAVGRQAEVLVRYNRGALPLHDAAGRPIDVLRKLEHVRKAGRPRDWLAWVHVNGKALPGRLCAVRLPTDKADEARARIRREQGADATAETLAMADFVVVFTTVRRDRLRCELVLELYRARWQVELDFKRDKSITGLDRLPNFRPDTIASWIYAKLILHQILRTLACSDSTGAIPPSAIAQACLDQRRAA